MLKVLTFLRVSICLSVHQFFSFDCLFLFFFLISDWQFVCLGIVSMSVVFPSVTLFSIFYLPIGMFVFLCNPVNTFGLSFVCLFFNLSSTTVCLSFSVCKSVFHLFLFVCLSVYFFYISFVSLLFCQTELSLREQDIKFLFLWKQIVASFLNISIFDITLW